MRVVCGFLLAVTMAALPPAGAAQSQSSPAIFGDRAWLVEDRAPGRAMSVAAALDCIVSNQNPSCKLHPITWTAGPTGADAIESTRKSGKREGFDFLVCAVASGGSLTACQTTGNEAQIVGLDLLHSFKAPASANDGAPIGSGPIAIYIDWAAISTKVTCPTPARYFPLKAERANIPGAARINCLVEPIGNLSDCFVVEENPVGYDFGSAALCLAPLFKMKPTRTAPLGGVRVTVPFNFALPQ